MEKLRCDCVIPVRILKLLYDALACRICCHRSRHNEAIIEMLIEETKNFRHCKRTSIIMRKPLTYLKLFMQPEIYAECSDRVCRRKTVPRVICWKWCFKPSFLGGSRMKIVWQDGDGDFPFLKYASCTYWRIRHKKNTLHQKTKRFPYRIQQYPATVAYPFSICLWSENFSLYK